MEQQESILLQCSKVQGVEFKFCYQDFQNSKFLKCLTRKRFQFITKHAVQICHTLYATFPYTHRTQGAIPRNYEVENIYHKLVIHIQVILHIRAIDSSTGCIFIIRNVGGRSHVS